MKNSISAHYKQLSLGIVLALSLESSQATTLVQPTDLFLSVWDSTAQQSYSYDLQKNLADFVTSSSSNISFNLPSDFTTWATTQLGKGDFLSYNIAAQDLRAWASTSPKDAMLLSQDHARTGTFSPVATNLTNALLNSAQLKIQNRINDINVTYSQTGTALVTDPSLQGYFQGTGANVWGTGQGSNSRDDSSTLGTGGSGTNQLDIYYITSSGTSASAAKTLQQFLPGYFTLDNSLSQLNWVSSSVASVPIPNSIWLSLTGLMALLGLQKRKRV